MSSTIGVKDVAALAGVSVGTVSNVLNRPERVGEATRRRVQQAITDLGFVRNESGRHLRVGRSRTIAYLGLAVTNPFFTDVAKGVDEVARHYGLAVFLCNSDGDPSREADYLEMLLEQRVRGVLVSPFNPLAEHLEQLRRRGVAVVLVGATSGSDWCSAAVDDVRGGQLAVDHLLDHGHRRIAFVGGSMYAMCVADRLLGARKALAAAGGDPDDLTVIETVGLSVTEGRRAGEVLLGRSRRRRPTAAFCANDLVAIGLLQHMAQSGIDVPGELAIIGYDDIDFAGAAAVPLSSIRQPRQRLGHVAAELLLAEADAPVGHIHQQVILDTELIVRASSSRPRRTRGR
jgi:LacI family transcriptional regulator, galactose operon repressor